MPVADTWWQTETGAVMISPPRAVAWPGARSAMYLFFGVAPVLDAAGAEIEDEVAEGLLAIKAPWPSAMRSVWGDHQRMEETYFPFDGYYLTVGDEAEALSPAGTSRSTATTSRATARAATRTAGTRSRGASKTSSSSRATTSARPRSRARSSRARRRGGRRRRRAARGQGGALCYVTLNGGEAPSDALKVRATRH